MLRSNVGLLLVIPIYFIFLFICIRKKFSLFKHILLILFFIYIGLLIAVTIFPLPFQPQVIQFNRENDYLKNNFIPFKSIYYLIKTNDLHIIIRNILGNIIMFMPLGFLSPLLFDKFKKIGNEIILGLCFSISIEFCQYIISFIVGYTYKITDIDDIFLNIIGLLLGYLAFKIFIAILDKKN